MDMPVQQMQPLFISTISSLAWMTSPSSIPTSPASRPGIRVHTTLVAGDGIAARRILSYSRKCMSYRTRSR